MERLHELLKGKKIAYVAPTDDGLAADLEGFDLIIRAGIFSPIPGQHTDIVVHSFNSVEIRKANENIEFFKTLKFVIQSMTASTELPLIRNWMYTLEEFGVPCARQDDEWILKNIREQTATIPNAGMIGLKILLETELKEIHMFGFNFYNWGNYGKVYSNQHFNDATSAGVFQGSGEYTASGPALRNDLHHQSNQIAWFKELLKTEPRIIIDQQMKEGLDKY